MSIMRSPYALTEVIMYNKIGMRLQEKQWVGNT